MIAMAAIHFQKRGICSAMSTSTISPLVLMVLMVTARTPPGDPRYPEQASVSRPASYQTEVLIPSVPDIRADVSPPCVNEISASSTSSQDW